MPAECHLDKSLLVFIVFLAGLVLHADIKKMDGKSMWLSVKYLDYKDFSDLSNIQCVCCVWRPFP